MSLKTTESVSDLGLHCLFRPVYLNTKGKYGQLIHRNPASILYESTAGRYRPVSYPDEPITARYRSIKNAYWVNIWNMVVKMIRVYNVCHSSISWLWSGLVQSFSTHYENTPFQIYRKFRLQKLKNLHIKLWYFSYICSKHRSSVLVRTASLRRF